MKCYVRDLNEYKNQDKSLFQYEVENNSITLTKYTGKESNPEVPSEIDGYPVEVI